MTIPAPAGRAAGSPASRNRSKPVSYPDGDARCTTNSRRVGSIAAGEADLVRRRPAIRRVRTCLPDDVTLDSKAADLRRR